MPTWGERASQAPRDHLVAVGDLVKLVERYAEYEAVNSHIWPGLTFYRFSAPVPAHQASSEGISGIPLSRLPRLRGADTFSPRTS
jgi:hypothetical protein